MKKNYHILIIVLLFVSFSSFSPKNEIDFIGTYGVAENDSSDIKLTINKDKTFTYKDLSNTNKPIDVEGNWEIKGNQIILINYTSDYNFHTKWRITNEGNMAKSRKGITFYSLSKM